MMDLRKKCDKFIEDLFSLFGISQERAQNNFFVCWLRRWYSLVEHVYKFSFNWLMLIIIFYWALWVTPQMAILKNQALAGCNFVCFDKYNSTARDLFMNDTDIICRCGGETGVFAEIRPNGEMIAIPDEYKTNVPDFIDVSDLYENTE
jgi:hypothetical protein